MSVIVDLQIVDKSSSCPNQEQCELTIQLVLNAVGISEPKECTIRIVDTTESAALNKQYRRKEGATNVLAFPFDSPIDIGVELLGDIVICAPLVIAQAQQQHQSVTMHWHHLMAHGCLHLLGYDHHNDSDAEEMETLECQIMGKLGYADPYQITDNL